MIHILHLDGRPHTPFLFIKVNTLNAAFVDNLTINQHELKLLPVSLLLYTLQ